MEDIGSGRFCETRLVGSFLREQPREDGFASRYYFLYSEAKHQFYARKPSIATILDAASVTRFELASQARASRFAPPLGPPPNFAMMRSFDEGRMQPRRIAAMRRVVPDSSRRQIASANSFQSFFIQTQAETLDDKGAALAVPFARFNTARVAHTNLVRRR